MATLTLQGVVKCYAKGVPAIHPLDLTIHDGELLVLVGPSGCGKSTLLRMIAGLEPITAGELLLDGERINHKEPSERDMAMVFQNYALYPHMSVFDNLAYGLRNRRTPKAEVQRQVTQVAGLLGLEELLTRKPRQLSGGQRQRVAMGRAMVRQPRVFLFDEPLSNLDAKLRGQMRLEIKRLQRRLGTTALYVTHDQVEAMTLADRLVVLNQGRVEQIGAPLELYDRPQSLFVATFLGAPAMNLLPVRQASDGLWLGTGGWLPLPGLPQGVTTLGIRPEHLQWDPRGSLCMQVAWLEALGAELLVHGPLLGGEPDQPCLVLRLAGQVGDSRLPPLLPGSRLPLSCPPERLHLFDAQGQRLRYAGYAGVDAAAVSPPPLARLAV